MGIREEKLRKQQNNHTAPLKRRDVLVGAGSLAAGATLSFPAPAVATVGAATGGRIKIEVFLAGAFVRPLETFDAVSAGVADMYHTYEGYFQNKSQALHFFAAIPLGFTADELFAWVQYGGGQDLWDALNAQFNIKSLLCTSTGCQMGGWFAREITSPEDFRGLRYRMAGPGAEVLRRMGATVVSLPGGGI